MPPKVINVSRINLFVGAALSGGLGRFVVRIGCFCLAASVVGGHNLLRVVASIHRHLAKSHIIVVSAMAFVCGSTLAVHRHKASRR
jgi:hypothetical protein